jgi:signal transduction histidine kinase
MSGEDGMATRDTAPGSQESANSGGATQGAGTRPSAMRHLMHDRAARFAAGLAIVVAIPVAVLFYFQFKSLNALEEASALVLRQLSGDTTDSLASEIEEAFKRPHIDMLLRTGQGRLEPFDRAWVDPIFAQGLTDNPYIEELWIWSENAVERAEGSTADPVEKFYVFDRASLEVPAAATAERFRESEARRAQVLPMVREIATQRRAIVAFPATIDGRPKYLQVQLRFRGPDRQRVSSFIGFMVDAGFLRSTYFPSLIEKRLAAVQQPTGFPPLDLHMIDGGGRALDGRAVASDVFVDERTFPLVFFDKELLEYAAPYEQRRETWRIRAGYGNQSIPEIVSASTRPQLALMIVLALVMAGGVFFVAGAAAREVRVAEIKSNFVASVSHDLKTPLALIQLFAETLELGRVRNAERAQEYYRIINTEARKLTRLIENILDFSRMEAGLRPYRLAPTALADVTRQVLSSMESQFTQTQFNVVSLVEPDLPTVEADERAVVQALENLLANAMKYSGDSRDIDVRVGRENGHVCVSVSDHGIGIARRDQKKVFRKFFRVENDLGGGPQGCGLGLAIVDHTMRGHGGFVDVDSEPNRGSTFTLHFPIPGDATAAAAPRVMGASTEGDGHEAHSGDRGRTADVARSA